MDDRGRNQVQDILDHHNSKYGVQVKGRAAVIYPQLEGQPGWDWVCYDPKEGDEIALVVKRLTEEGRRRWGISLGWSWRS